MSTHFLCPPIRRLKQRDRFGFFLFVFLCTFTWMRLSRASRLSGSWTCRVSFSCVSVGDGKASGATEAPTASLLLCRLPGETLIQGQGRPHAHRTTTSLSVLRNSQDEQLLEINCTCFEKNIQKSDEQRFVFFIPLVFFYAAMNKLLIGFQYLKWSVCYNLELFFFSFVCSRNKSPFKCLNGGFLFFSWPQTPSAA